MEGTGANTVMEETEQTEQSVEVSQTEPEEMDESEIAQMDEQHMAKMRSARQYKLSQLTRRMNIIKELMKDNMVTDEVNENVQRYKAMLSQFKDAHSSYQALINESGDDDKIN